MNRPFEPCGDLNSFLEGRLLGNAGSRFEQHLDSCATCTDALAAWGEIKGQYVAWVRTGEPLFTENPDRAEAAAFATRVSERCSLKRTPRPRARRPYLRMLAAAAALVTIVWGIIYLIAERQPASKPAVYPTEERARPAEHAALPTVALKLVEITNGVAVRRVLNAGPDTAISAPPQGRVWIDLGDDRMGIDALGIAFVSSADPADTIIHLDRGVAAFKVSRRGSGQRFRVMVGTVQIEVIGTRFAVSKDLDIVRVTVGEGTVQVHDGKSTVTVPSGFARMSTGGASPSTVRAEADQLLQISRLLSEGITADDKEKRTSADEGAADGGMPHEPVPRAHEVKRRMPEKRDAVWRELILDGKTTEAEAEITAYLKAFPEDADARMLRAACFKKMGRYRDAVDEYANVSTFPATVSQTHRARYLAGELSQSKLGDDKAAKRFFEAYLYNAPKSAANRAEAELHLAESLLRLGDTARAKSILAQMVDAYGRTPIANRARALLEQTP